MVSYSLQAWRSWIWKSLLVCLLACSGSVQVLGRDMPQPLDLREVAMDTVEALWKRGTAYRWGGDDPMDGVDCSGLVIEGLRSAGILERDGDWTADQLYNVVFKSRTRYDRSTQLRRGMLVFWKNPLGKVRHVEMVWAVYPESGGMRVLTIGASGGGSSTTSKEAATAQNAYVKVRPLAPNWSAAVDPFGS